jgi:hypothetical protein
MRPRRLYQLGYPGTWSREEGSNLHYFRFNAQLQPQSELGLSRALRRGNS